MSRVVPWLEVVKAASSLVPEPAGTVLRVATHLAGILIEEGCTIDGCPADVAAKLMPADVPTGERQLAARRRNRTRRT